jgi:O-antigen ligase
VTSRAQLEAALDIVAAVLVAGCVIAAAAGSSIQYDILVVGRPARWVLIGLLLAFALGRAAFCIRMWRVPRLTAFALVAFCGLCLVSVVWSVNSHGTFVRAVGQGAVVVAVGALAGCIASRPALAGRMLDGLLAAVAVVALAGFVFWLLSPSRAAIPASVEYPSRFRGIEENPNTAALLLAIGMALALARAVRAQRAVARSGFVLLVLGFAASITASGSRGGLLAAFVGLFAVAVLSPIRLRTRVAVAAVVVAGLGISAWTMTIPKALQAPAPTAPAAVTSTASGNAEAVLPLVQEIGNPWWTHRAGDSKRSLFNTNVRARAWEGAFHQALGRPLLGYGFGAERWAFVNRYYAFSSENPENGYLGLFLQVGALGLAAFLAVVALCLVPAGRAALRGSWNAVAAAGAVAAALAAGISQSYFHGAGSIAYVAFWVALLLSGVMGSADNTPSNPQTASASSRPRTGIA